jgi:hypothetical protein
MKQGTLWARNEQDEGLGYPQQVYPITAGIVGGLLGGAAMVIPAVAYGLISGKGAWYAINLVAGTIINFTGVTEQQIGQFNLGWFLIAFVLHLFISLLIGLLFALLLPTLPGRPQLWAIVIGPLLWFGATAIILPLINPAMSQRLDWFSFIVANIIYSLVMGFWIAYTPKVPHDDGYSLKFYPPTFVSTPPAQT